MFKVIQGGEPPQNQNEEKPAISLEMFEAFARQAIEIESKAEASCAKIDSDKKAKNSEPKLKVTGLGSLK